MDPLKVQLLHLAIAVSTDRVYYCLCLIITCTQLKFSNALALWVRYSTVTHVNAFNTLGISFSQYKFTFSDPPFQNNVFSSHTSGILPFLSFFFKVSRQCNASFQPPMRFFLIIPRYVAFDGTSHLFFPCGSR